MVKLLRYILIVLGFVYFYDNAICQSIQLDQNNNTINVQNDFVLNNLNSLNIPYHIDYIYGLNIFDKCILNLTDENVNITQGGKAGSTSSSLIMLKGNKPLKHSDNIVNITVGGISNNLSKASIISFRNETVLNSSLSVLYLGGKASVNSKAEIKLHNYYSNSIYSGGLAGGTSSNVVVYLYAKNPNIALGGGGSGYSASHLPLQFYPVYSGISIEEAKVLHQNLAYVNRQVNCSFSCEHSVISRSPYSRTISSFFACLMNNLYQTNNFKTNSKSSKAILSSISSDKFVIRKGINKKNKSGFILLSYTDLSYIATRGSPLNSFIYSNHFFVNTSYSSLDNYYNYLELVSCTNSVSGKCYLLHYYNVGIAKGLFSSIFSNPPPDNIGKFVRNLQALNYQPNKAFSFKYNLTSLHLTSGSNIYNCSKSLYFYGFTKFISENNQETASSCSLLNINENVTNYNKFQLEKYCVD